MATVHIFCLNISNSSNSVYYPQFLFYYQLQFKDWLIFMHSLLTEYLCHYKVITNVETLVITEMSASKKPMTKLKCVNMRTVVYTFGHPPVRDVMPYHATCDRPWRLAANPALSDTGTHGAEKSIQHTHSS
jgi:hypothetical protein